MKRILLVVVADESVENKRNIYGEHSYFLRKFELVSVVDLIVEISLIRGTKNFDGWFNTVRVFALQQNRLCEKYDKERWQPCKDAISHFSSGPSHDAAPRYSYSSEGIDKWQTAGNLRTAVVQSLTLAPRLKRHLLEELDELSGGIVVFSIFVISDPLRCAGRLSRTRARPDSSRGREGPTALHVDFHAGRPAECSGPSRLLRIKDPLMGPYFFLLLWLGSPVRVSNVLCPFGHSGIFLPFVTCTTALHDRQ